MENSVKNYGHEDFTYDDHTKEIKEIIDGKIYYMGGGIFVHSDVITNIAFEFNYYFRIKKKKCKAYNEGLKVFLDRKRENEYVLPDIIVICDRKRHDRLGYKGQPEIIIEVISESSRRDDKITKLNFYERAGVKEYWLVEPELRSIEQYVLEDNRYSLQNVLTLLSEEEFSNLSDEQKASYVTVIKPTMFDDLEIDLKNIFQDDNEKE